MSLNDWIEFDTPPYVAYCPRCGDPGLIPSHRDYMNGTLCESTDECRRCGYYCEFSYGSTNEGDNSTEENARMIGMHDEHNADDPFKLELSITALVQATRRMKYGEHRFLSELVRQRKKDPLYKSSTEFKNHTDMLEELLEAGFF
jgi:hypothetical protein